jgi:hypothetical protein
MVFDRLQLLTEYNNILPMIKRTAKVNPQTPTQKMPVAFFVQTRQSGNQAIRQSGNYTHFPITVSTT